MNWHVPEQTMRAYVEGRTADADAWSVEAHLTSCEQCREALAGASADVPQLAASISDGWAAVADGLVEQGQVRLGTRWRKLALLMMAGPAARLGWLVATVVVLALAAGLGTVMPMSSGEEMPMLGVVAPLVPILGVAASYGTGLDDAYEVITSTPAGGLRLLLYRSAAVLAVTSVVGVAAGAVAGYGSPVPWLLASLGLTLLTLALGSTLGIGRAAAVVGVTWMALLGTDLLVPSATDGPLPLTLAFTPAWAAVSVLAVLVIMARREAFDRMPLPARRRLATEI